MKSYLAALGLIAMLSTVGCEESMMDRKADDVRDATQNTAENIRDNADHAADSVRAADGKTITGEAETRVGENQADAIEEVGEAKADAVEQAGENKADRLESLDN